MDDGETPGDRIVVAGERVLLRRRLDEKVRCGMETTMAEALDRAERGAFRQMQHWIREAVDR